MTNLAKQPEPQYVDYLRRVTELPLFGAALRKNKDARRPTSRQQKLSANDKLLNWRVCTAALPLGDIPRAPPKTADLA